MGEKYYRPIMEEGEHLVHSKKNPKRFRGQARDCNNKNPNIVEWEEVEIDTDFGERDKSEDTYRSSQYEDAYRYRYDEEDDEEYYCEPVSRLDVAIEALETINNLLVFLNEHPEIVEAAINCFKRVKGFVSEKSKKLVLGVRGFIQGKKEAKPEDILNQAELLGMTNETFRNEDIIDEDKVSDDQNEEMSVDEARSLIIDILENYINMKKKVERLSKAKVSGTDFHMDDILSYMDTIVGKYPELMDERTSTSILELLRINADKTENMRILETLKIQ